MGKPSDLVQGTLDVLILKTLSLEPKHGWAIAKRIQQVSGEVLQVQQRSLYPALHRLEQQGWIRAKWAESETGRQAGFAKPPEPMMYFPLYKGIEGGATLAVRGIRDVTSFALPIQPSWFNSSILSFRSRTF